MRRLLRQILGALLLAGLPVPAMAADAMTAPAYPETRRQDIVETIFGAPMNRN